MANITKTTGTSVLSLQSVAGNTVLISSDIDVSTKLAATILIWFGRRSASSGTAGVNIRIEVSGEASGDSSWKSIYVFTTAFAAVEPEAVSGTVGSGTNVITVASTTNLTIGTYIFIDNGTIANSEWKRIKSVSANTSVTTENNLANAQTGATMYAGAEDFICSLDLTAIKRLRVVVDGASFTQAFAIKSLIITGDSIG